AVPPDAVPPRAVPAAATTQAVPHHAGPPRAVFPPAVSPHAVPPTAVTAIAVPLAPTAADLSGQPGRPGPVVGADPTGPEDGEAESFPAPTAPRSRFIDGPRLAPAARQAP